MMSPFGPSLRHRVHLICLVHRPSTADRLSDLTEIWNSEIKSSADLVVKSNIWNSEFLFPFSGEGRIEDNCVVLLNIYKCMQYFTFN